MTNIYLSKKNPNNFFTKSMIKWVLIVDAKNLEFDQRIDHKLLLVDSSLEIDLRF